MSTQSLKVSTDARGVMTVALNRPEVRNAFNDQVIDELASVFGKDALAPEIRAVVLKGEGKSFCAGGDVNWIKKAIDYDFNENLKDTRKLAQMFATLNECPKPVVGLIHGAAVGGGVGLVSICDIVIASSETLFSLSEVRLGVVPACIGPFVISKIGASHARYLFVSAEKILAPRAKEIGLIHEVVAEPGDLPLALDKILENILLCAPNAMAVAKRLVHDLTWAERRAHHPDSLEYVAKTLADVRVSPEAQEGLRAFIEKRQPAWLGGKPKK